MDMERVFQITALILLLSGFSFSIYFRRIANQTGEEIDVKEEGGLILNLRRIFGLLLWFSAFAYLINPAWMAWSKIGLPEWARWLGVGIGLLCLLGIYWLFSSIGVGITPTSATRQEHKLSTSGPYRWVRHPLYSIGSSFFIAFGMMADNWFIASLGVLTFILMAIRTQKEEANLLDKFGDEYREYMKCTGRFLPKFGGTA